MGSRLVSVPIHDDQEQELAVLQPLLLGRPVALAVHDPKMRMKKRAGTPVLLIAPSSLYGLDDNKFIFSLPGYGCEVASIKELRVTHLFRLGLTAHAAKVLIETLTELFYGQRKQEVNDNGNT